MSTPLLCNSLTLPIQLSGSPKPATSLCFLHGCPGEKVDVLGVVLPTSHLTAFFWAKALLLMGPAWLQVPLTGTLWLLVLWAFLSPVCCSHDPPVWRFASSEIVIPRKVPPRRGGVETPDQLSYSIRFQGRRHVIHMKLKKALLPRHFPIITNNDQGAMQEDYPFVPRDCYYYSYLEGVPGSMATLDTCYGGLRGMIQVDDSTYEIKPLEASSKFEHLVSLLVSEERPGEAQKCNIDDEQVDEAFEKDMQLKEPTIIPTGIQYAIPTGEQFFFCLYLSSVALHKQRDL
ncbi:disintegrin and metalloproteinase domain-containing protein 20-like [Microcebus murinus]|uniref:disintegrin and metalloproteinase domain-containing protein 20-like n=1 Tax=Microcebus murinus TaxID=30608 RepID=UPI003F6D4884